MTQAILLLMSFPFVLKEHDHVCVRPGGPSWQGLWHDDFLSCAVLWSARVHLESAHAHFCLVGYLVCVFVFADED